MRILLVEDDPEQLEPLQTALSQAGHIVDGLQDGDIAQRMIAQRDYDLLILDWMLPRVSGLSLCCQYRALGKTAPVLMLTARDAIGDKVASLDAGADDYLVKPTNLIELLARVRALGRRPLACKKETLTLGDLTLHLTNLTVERRGASIELSSREFQLLEYLLRHPHQVLSRDQIEQALWAWGDEPESNAITTLVRRLRHRLSPLQAADWIETIYGMGYRICPN
ncbi:response regulator transcription factor [Nodosilinea sp. LEGE 06152]|uniref:response regulator transcription factor n=1 Tax=Nodosilinea sp. LEGE 06152 TaxID=2777966 RepID=UPI00187FD3C6|nr:response regulator transcription factor [Nodosilinea sp. LEGE 06152]MBE9158733.1 response regulator transcription factor [Nodosilinea sp. LEGE 06152]